MTMTVKNFDPQIMAPRKAPVAVDTAGSYSVGEAPAEEGEFAAILNDEELGGELSFDPESLVDPAPVPSSLIDNTTFAMGKAPLEGLTPIDAEGPTPKVMDASLIEQVDGVIAPEGVDQVMVNPEMLTPEMSESPLTLGKAIDRAPGIDLSESEVDEQLMDLPDFVAQRNAFARRAPPTEAYGMPVRTPSGMSEARLVDPEMIKSLNTEKVDGEMPVTMTKPDSIPMMLEKPDTVQPNGKVFDLSALKGQPLDTDSVMQQIQDYVVQARASKEPTVQMKMNHQDLGMIDITVQKMQNNVVNIAINSQDQGTKMFLGQHREQLLGHLSQAGVNVGDLKFDSHNSSSDTASGGFNGQNPGQHRQYGSEQNQRQDDRQRRQDLWSLLREKEVA